MITFEPLLCISDPSDEVNLWVKSPKRDIKEGDTVEFECLGNGNPQPLVTFRREVPCYREPCYVMFRFCPEPLLR